MKQPPKMNLLVSLGLSETSLVLAAEVECGGECVKGYQAQSPAVG